MNIVYTAPVHMEWKTNTVTQKHLLHYWENRTKIISPPKKNPGCSLETTVFFFFYTSNGRSRRYITKARYFSTNHMFTGNVTFRWCRTRVVVSKSTIRIVQELRHYELDTTRWAVERKPVLLWVAWEGIGG